MRTRLPVIYCKQNICSLVEDFPDNFSRWSGTPLITLQGEKMAARVATSILRAVGLDSQLACSTLQGELHCFIIDANIH